MNDGWLNFFSAVTGGLIAGGASLYAAKMMMDKQRFDRAAEKFVTKILNEVKFIYGTGATEATEVIFEMDKTLVEITIAAKEFKPHVKNKAGFNKALSRYTLCCTQWYLGGSEKIVPDLAYEHGRREYKVIYKKRVDELLLFAETRANPLGQFSKKAFDELSLLIEKIKQNGR